MVASNVPGIGKVRGYVIEARERSPLFGNRPEVVNLFLEQFSRELPAGVHAVLIWDGAGFHTSADLEVPSNVSVIRLVPYSPELNPVENLWHYLRSHYWSLRVYRDYT